MWIYDEGLIRSLLVSMIMQWIFSFVFLAVMYFAGVTWFVLVFFLPIIALTNIFETLQYFAYAKGIFISDFELVLPGVGRRKFNAQELEKIILPRMQSKGRYSATFVFKKGSRSVMFSTLEKRQEVVELVSDFCPHVQIIDKSKKSR
ncbi:hypothetical protein AJ81_09460 [Pseudothermotoga hypogea DSM 11164 = NBRC 106472]|uniref:DUF304 domain-containing protein n=1 Tax=Pseudothermotoga hypogea DSM 11164 = NBRC 106472 TaxID=1123384 RepID=A0A0X1KUK1_9THEM|nr:hypothetical protein [Pseudothermotoga hypogea]AJC74906.1 hypothetical protein AJ81_09460 [Pseudothermotoga hypogea DSM 11164 = NBRC 106472]